MAHNPPCPSPWPTYPAKYRHACDGDALVADVYLAPYLVAVGQRIRLAGIDAPECVGRTKWQGDSARRRLHELCDGRQIIIQLADLSPDRWGRWVAWVWADEAFVQGQLVMSGNARPWRGGPASPYETWPGSSVLLPAERPTW